MESALKLIIRGLSMRKKSWLTYIAFLVCASSYTAVWAVDSKPDAKPAAAATAASASLDKKQQAELSARADAFLNMVSYGEAEKDPIVLLSAVKLLDSLPFASVSTTDEKGKEAKQFDRDTILKQAKEFAAGDTELLAIIAKVQDAPAKTEVRGYGGRDRFGRYDGRYHDGRYYGGHFYYERPIHDRRFDRRFERYWHNGRWYWR
jgi:hypothetical protein